MSELVILLEVILAWTGCSLFVGFYWFRSNWESTLPGRVLMHFGITFWVLLSYALVLRAVQPPDWVHGIMAHTIYAAIAISMWRLFFVVRAAQLGKLSINTPNYQPIRDWIRARRAASSGK